MIQGICGLFGSLLNFLYNLFGQNYGFAIIGFTLVINIILLPLTLKQQKSTADMQLIQPELTALQAKYKNDKEKLNAEMMKLYQKHNVNPASGCLPLLIQLPIILILYQVIIKPLSYMLGYTAEQLKELTTLVYGAEHTAPVLSEVTLAADAAKLGAEKLSELSFDFTTLNLNFFGFDLGATPSFSQPSILWLIPILAGVTTYMLSWYTMRQTTKSKGQDQKKTENTTANQMQTMNKIMPLITVYFAFTFAAGIGLYWIMNNVFRFLQQVVVNVMMEKKAASDPLVIEPEANNKKKKKK